MVLGAMKVRYSVQRELALPCRVSAQELHIDVLLQSTVDAPRLFIRGFGFVQGESGFLILKQAEVVVNLGLLEYSSKKSRVWAQRIVVEA